MSEPFRNCRKLHKLRGWGHRKTEQVFNRGSGTCHELRRAYEILRKALAFPIGGARPQTEEMTAFIDAHCGAVQVESICRVLLIAPSVYYEYKDREAYPSLLPAIAVRGTYLTGEIERVWRENRWVCGTRKVWRQINREDIRVARCTVERLMRSMGWQGVVRGHKPRTTIPYESRRDRSIWFSETSRRHAPNSSGWQTSPTLRRVGASYMWHSSSTCSPG